MSTGQAFMRRARRAGPQATLDTSAQPLEAGHQRVSVTWTKMLALLMLMVLGLGAVAISSTTYQRARFNDVTSQLETELDASVSLIRDLGSLDTPLGSVFYELGTLAHRENQFQTFTQRAAQIDAGFDHAQAVVPVRSTADPLARARTAWDETADAVRAARELWGTSVVSDALAAGDDPYAKQWEQLRGAQTLLLKVTAQSLEALHDKRASAEKMQQIIPLVVLGALILTLVIGALSARRLSRGVVMPLQSLRSSALRMRDGDLLTNVDVGGAGVELRDLAAAMTDLASWLHTSHGLLREQAETDALTGLPNRKAITEYLLRHDEEGRGEGMALLFIDLDDFKIVNDSLGHDAGDQLLCIVASRLRSAARAGDLVARLGGDEFAIVLPHGGDHGAAAGVAERILSSLRGPVSVNGTAVSAGCSIGIALSGPSSGHEDLLRDADIAMYAAKNGGKNRFAWFTPAMHTEMVARVDLKADLMHATDLGQLNLVYQPVVDLAQDSILGWEALVRWQHPERDLLLPSEFIPTAEDTGDILAIGQWVLDRACEDFVQVLGSSGQSGRWVSVNIAARQLAQPGFADTVRQSLRRCGLEPRSLVLEITEGALVTDTTRAAEALASLRRDGVRIALDDFGTGFASLRYLQKLPIDIIKIDRSFVTVSDTFQWGVLDAIVTLGESLGMEMVAEGIEGAAELDRVRHFAGVAGQGYHIARPMPIEQARTFTLAPLTVG